MCGSALIKGRTQGWILGVLFGGIWLAGSRASFGALFAVLAMGLFIQALSFRNIVFGGAVAAATLAVIAALPYVVVLLGGGSGGGGSGALDLIVFQMTPVSSDMERFTSIAGGLQLFLLHPLFGNGLGAYASDKITHGQFVVIHSTPIWLLAEMGLFGFLAFAVPAVRIFRNEWTSSSRDGVGQMLLLMLVTFGIMSLVHELLYQRALWLLLGGGLACVASHGRPEARTTAV